MRFNRIENKGVKRILFVAGVIFAMVWFVVGMDRDVSDGIAAMLISFVLYWIIVRVWLWVYDGFASSKKSPTQPT